MDYNLCYYQRLCSHLVPGHRHKMVLCPDTGYPICWYVHIQQPSTCPLHLKCANRIMRLFRVQYICLIIAFYGFFTFFMLCLCMKHLRDQMDYDDRRRLARIVTETCAAISRRLNVFLTDRSQVGGRAAWKIPRHFLCKHIKEMWVRKGVVCG